MMRTIRVLEKTSKDGTLSLCRRAAHGAFKTKHRTRLAFGVFDQTSGAISDDTFIRHPQGELPKPVEFD